MGSSGKVTQIVLLNGVLTGLLPDMWVYNDRILRESLSIWMFFSFMFSLSFFSLVFCSRRETPETDIVIL